MQTLNSGVTACRYCQHYRLEGRRGGQCQQLSVPVQGGWKACQLALPPFAPSWEDSDSSISWQQEALGLERALAESTELLELHPVERAGEGERLPINCGATQAIAEAPLTHPILK